MATIQSLGELATIKPPWSMWPQRQSVHLYDSYNYDYATLYRTQPNVRVCVDFLARNIAQLGLHTFRRVSDTDRARLRDHGLAQLLARPLPPTFKVTTYRLIESMMSDLGIYFNSYWLKIPRDGQIYGLLRVPPAYMKPVGGLVISGYEMNVAGKTKEFMPDEVVHFRGYNPENPLDGLSPLETLRRTLAEEHEAGDYRQHFWRNAARMGGVIKRPATAPEWSEPARNRFLADFEQLYSGGENSGKTAVLEDGMEWQQNTFTAQESEYLAGRKLTREECARSYHIPLPLVGILDHATFSNVKEQHKHLYQDSLGPWLAMIEQDIEMQLLPEWPDNEGVYVEFNIAEKLAGSFEEQVQAIQASVGRPWMSGDEARARFNLPAMGGDMARPVTPLNVLTGGQASPQDSAPPKALAAATFEQKAFSAAAPDMRQRHQEKWTEVLSRHYRRQEAAMMSRIPKAAPPQSPPQGREAKTDIGGVWWDDARWNEELTADLFQLNYLTAVAWAEMMAAQWGGEVSEDRMLAWLSEHSRIQAENFNGQTRTVVEEALRQPEPREAVKNVFVVALSAWVLRQAISGVTSAANFGANEAANAGGLREKTWRVNSGNPRDAHAAMNGETVGIRDLFSNGMRWPGDPAGGADNNAGCQCSVDFA